MTVLGFCLLVIVALLFASAPLVAALDSGDERSAVPYVLVFLGLLVVGIVVVVLGTALFGKNPMRLQLRDVSGSEFADYARFLKMGDSLGAEHPVIEAERRHELQEGAEAGANAPAELAPGDEGNT